MKKGNRGRRRREPDGLIERTLRFVEKDRAGILWAFAIVFVFGFVRSVMESSVFQYPGDSLYLRANHVALYFGLFMTGVLLITLASGISGRKIFNVVLFGWFIILLPPIIDFLIGPSGNGYPYQKNPNIILTMERMFNPYYIQKVGWGEFIQLLSIIILSSIYVFLRKKSGLRAFLTGLFLLFFMVYISASMAFIINLTGSAQYFILFQYFYFPIHPEYYAGMNAHTASFLASQQLYLFVSLYYTLMFLTSSALFMYIYSKERTIYFFKSIKWDRIVASIALVYAGVIVSGAIYPEYIMHEVYIGFAAIAATSAAQFWNMMEDLGSKKEWKAPYTRKQYRNVAIAFLLLSVCSSYLLGNGPFAMVLLFLFTGYLYTSKPFEGRETPVAPFIHSLYGVFPFLIGFYTPSYWLIKIWGKTVNSPYTLGMATTIEMPVEHPLTQLSLVSLTAIYAISFFIILLYKNRK